MSDGASRRLAVFVGVLAVVLVGSMIGGFVVADTPPERSDATVEKDYFTSEELVSESELAPKSGEIDVANQPSRTVLLSTDGDPTELEPVVNALVTHGHEVRIHGGGASTAPVPVSGIVGVGAAQSSVSAAEGGLETELGESDALMIVGGSQIDEADHDTIEEFADAGGPVTIATDPSSGFGGSEMSELTARFGMTVGGGYLYNMHDNDANFQRVFADGGDGDLADGVGEIVVDRAAPIRSDGGTSIATAGGETRYSTTRESGEFDIAVRHGNAVVIGDSSIAQPMQYNRADNEVLLGNVLEFLTGGPTSPYSPAPEPPAEEPPEQPMPTDGEAVAEEDLG